MPTEKVYTYFKEANAAEIDRMYKLDGMVNFPAATITVLVGIGAYYLQNSPEGFWFLFVPLLSLYGVSIFACVAFLVCSFWHHEYLYPADPLRIKSTALEMAAYFAEKEGAGRQLADRVNEEFHSQLVDRLAECASHNRATNEKRINRLYWMTVSLLVSLVLLVVVSVAFYTYRTPPTKVQDVKLISPVKIDKD